MATEEEVRETTGLLASEARAPGAPPGAAGTGYPVRPVMQSLVSSRLDETGSDAGASPAGGGRKVRRGLGMDTEGGAAGGATAGEGGPEAAFLKEDSPWKWLLLPEKHPSNDEARTVFLVINSMIGSGILNQPFVFHQAGIVPTTILYLIVGYAVWLGVNLLLEVAEATGLFSFALLADAAGGKPYAVTVDVAIVVGNFGALLSYIIIVGTLLSGLLQDWSDADIWAVSKYFVSSIAVIVVVFPICLTRHWGNLAVVAVLSTTAIMSVAVLVMFGSPFQAEQLSEGTSAINWASGTGTLSATGSILYTFSFAAVTFHAYSGLVPQRKEVWRRVTAKACGTGLCVCYAMGLIGYLSFRDDVDGDILSNFKWGWAALFKLLVVLHLLLYIPTDFVVLRHSFLRLFELDALTIATNPYILLTGGLLGVTLMTVLSLFWSGLSNGDAFSIVLDLTGGVALNFLATIFPGLLYRRLLAEDEPYHRHATGLFWVGMIFFLLIPITVIYEISTGNYGSA